MYSFDHTSPEKQILAQKLIEEALQSHKGCISFQVVQECLNVSTRKFSTPLSVSDAQQYLRLVLDPLCEVFPSIELYNKALEISERWQYSFYDSLIVGAALYAECAVLYTEDMQHKQQIHGLTIINPFSELAQITSPPVG